MSKSFYAICLLVLSTSFVHSMMHRRLATQVVPRISRSLPNQVEKECLLAHASCMKVHQIAVQEAMPEHYVAQGMFKQTPMRLMGLQEAQDVFNLSGNYSQVDVTKQYKKLARMHHPDRGGDLEKMKEVNEALKVLRENSTGCKYVDSELDERFTQYNDQYGMMSPLEQAIFNRNFDLVKQILEDGANINAKYFMHGSPLILAIQVGSVEVIKLLLEKGADVNAKGSSNRAPLSWAVHNNSIEMVQLLLDKGANVNPKGSKEDLLAIAVDKNNTEMVRLLLGKGAMIYTGNYDGWTLLTKAVFRDNMQVVKLLLKKNLDVNEKDDKGSRPLGWAVFNNNIEMVRLLLDEGADVDARCSCEEKMKSVFGPMRSYHWITPLSWAAYNNNIDIANLLLARGANVNIESCRHNIPLVVAARSNHTKMVRFLVDKGADVNGVGYDDSTSLMELAAHDNTQMVIFLIGRGADVHAKDGDGKNALIHYASRSKRDFNNLDTARVLLEHGTKVNACDNQGCTALYWASFNNNIEMVKLLLQKGANLNVQSNEKITALYWAAYRNNIKMVKLLLEQGALVSQDDLSCAVERKNRGIVLLLLRKSKGLTIGSTTSSFALRFAININDVEMVRLLLEKGAKPKESFEIQLALGKGNVEIVKLLLDHGATIRVSDWWQETDPEIKSLLLQKVKGKLAIMSGLGCSALYKLFSGSSKEDVDHESRMDCL